jgi:hypothetical protein
LPVAFQGVSRYSWQTVGNVLSLISGIIAGGLYGNIGKDGNRNPSRRLRSNHETGLKIVYVNIIEDMFKGPPLLSLKGRFAWTTLVIVFWLGGFVIAAAIPQVQTLSGMGGWSNYAISISC